MWHNGSESTWSTWQLLHARVPQHPEHACTSNPPRGSNITETCRVQLFQCAQKSAHMRQFPANAPPWGAHCIPTTCAHRFTSHTVMDAPRTPTLENKQCALRREMSIALHCASASQPKQTFHTISSLPFIRLGTIQGAKPTFFIIPTRVQTH
jgi:hypothetical protein